MADTYHPVPFGLIPVGNSGAFPLPQEVRLCPLLVQADVVLTTNTPQTTAVVWTPSVPVRTLDCEQAPITPGVYQGYFQDGPYRFFISNPQLRGPVIGPTIEHFPPGALTWPADIKPQIRVPDRIQALTVIPARQDCPVPPVDDEDSRSFRDDWPVFKHAYPKLKGLDLLVRPGQPAIAASVVAKVKGTTAVVDTGSISVISSIVVGSKGLKFDVPISNLMKQVRPEGLPLQIRISRSDSKANFEIAEFKNAVARLSGVEIIARSGSVTGLVGPDLQVEEDEELLFLLEVA